MAIFAVVVSIAIPGLTEWRRNNELRTSTRELASIMRYARSEAVARNADITVANKAGNDTWSGDILVYVDVSGGNSAYAAGSDTLLKDISVGGSDQVAVKSNTAGAPYVSYDNRGALDEAGNTVVFAICDSRGADSGFGIGVNTVGRVETYRLSGGQTCDP